MIFNAEKCGILYKNHTIVEKLHILELQKKEEKSWKVLQLLKLAKQFEIRRPIVLIVTLAWMILNSRYAVLIFISKRLR